MLVTKGVKLNGPLQINFLVLIDLENDYLLIEGILLQTSHIASIGSIFIWD